MADLQFMSFELASLSSEAGSDSADSLDHASSICATIDASARVINDSYGQRKLLLVPAKICQVHPPEVLILDGRRQSQSS